mgnify:CR=1 FL=1
MPAKKCYYYTTTTNRLLLRPAQFTAGTSQGGNLASRVGRDVQEEGGRLVHQAGGVGGGLDQYCNEEHQPAPRCAACTTRPTELWALWHGAVYLQTQALALSPCLWPVCRAALPRAPSRLPLSPSLPSLSNGTESLPSPYPILRIAVGAVIDVYAAAWGPSEMLDGHFSTVYYDLADKIAFSFVRAVANHVPILAEYLGASSSTFLFYLVCCC